MQACTIKEDYSTQKDFNYLASGDHHFGNKGQDKGRLKEEFQEAKLRNAKIFINGDWGDFILSGDRKRYTPGNDAYGTDNNINMAINEAYDFYGEYYDLIKMIGCGNHEVSLSKFHNFDPTQQLIYSLNKEFGKKNGEGITHGQYSGYILLEFKTKKHRGNQYYKIYYNHGQGGTAEISKGTIDINRHLTSKVADLIWIAHKHTKLVLPCEPTLDCTNDGKIFSKDRAGIITGTYMKTNSQYDAMKKGYIVNYGEERMRGLQSIGGIFIKITVVNNNLKVNFEV